MSARPLDLPSLDQRVLHVVYLVREALATATAALLGGEPATGRSVVDADDAIDELTAELDRVVWDRLDAGARDPVALRYLVAVLLILPELERSADLAEHIAQRAVGNLGPEMSPISRGIVQRMSEIALDMWRIVADAYAERKSEARPLDEADEELDILHDRLVREASRDAMPATIAVQVTLIARFYERLGDHAVNLARRIERLPAAQGF
jgi:phosphate transport system protein